MGECLDTGALLLLLMRLQEADELRVFAGKLCIEVTPQSKIVWISESLCIGCGICIKVAAHRLDCLCVFSQVSFPHFLLSS